MVRTDSRITDTQTHRQPHPQTTPRVSVETYSTRGETVGYKKDLRRPRRRLLNQIFHQNVFAGNLRFEALDCLFSSPWKLQRRRIFFTPPT